MNRDIVKIVLDNLPYNISNNKTYQKVIKPLAEQYLNVPYFNIVAGEEYYDILRMLYPDVDFSFINVDHVTTAEEVFIIAKGEGIDIMTLHAFKDITDELSVSIFCNSKEQIGISLTETKEGITELAGNVNYLKAIVDDVYVIAEDYELEFEHDSEYINYYKATYDKQGNIISVKDCNNELLVDDFVMDAPIKPEEVRDKIEIEASIQDKEKIDYNLLNVISKIIMKIVGKYDEVVFTSDLTINLARRIIGDKVAFDSFMIGRKENDYVIYYLKVTKGLMIVDELSLPKWALEIMYYSASFNASVPSLAEFVGIEDTKKKILVKKLDNKE